MLPEWTKLKMEHIEKYFELVELSDPSRPKSSEVWQQAIKRFKSKPNEVAVVGDNIKGDIQAARKVGVKHLFWIDAESSWDVYKIGEKPKEMRVVKNIGELPQKIIREVVTNTIIDRVYKLFQGGSVM